MNRILLLATLVSVCWEMTTASCLFRTREKIFCDAEFVVRANILSADTELGSAITKYRVDLKTEDIFRKTRGFNRKYIYGYNGIISIGIDLTPGTEYLLSGRFENGKPTFSSCEFVMEWSAVTADMQDFLQTHEC